MKHEELKTLIRNKLSECGILTKDDESIFMKRKLLISRGIAVGIFDFKNGSYTSILPGDESKVNSLTEQCIKNLRDFFREVESVTINTNVSLREFVNSFAKFMETSAPTENLDSTPISDLIDQIRNVK